MNADFYASLSPLLFFNSPRGPKIILRLFLAALLLAGIKITFAQETIPAQQQLALQSLLKKSEQTIWFEENVGQFGNAAVLYGWRTGFGSMGVYQNKLRLVTRQTKNGKNYGMQVVDIKFPGSTNQWTIEANQPSPVKGTYHLGERLLQPKIYQEIVLRDVYPGIDLRLYAGEGASLEFDWLVKKAADYRKIQMHFEGANTIKVQKDGSLVLKMEKQDLKIVIPETFQMTNAGKQTFSTAMVQTNKTTIAYQVANGFDETAPLVIDPVMVWSTYVHNNTKTFDEYLYAIAVNAASEVYACGVTNEAIDAGYMSGVLPGFSGSYVYTTTSAGDNKTAVLYRLNPTGTAITAWTYTGITNNIPVAMGIFPDNRVLVVYQKDTVQIFSADLNTRLYNGVLSNGLASGVKSYQSQTIINNDVFYVGGVAEAALPAALLASGVPDATISGDEGVIVRAENATTVPVPTWATYVGGSGDESFTAIAVTPDKSKIAFAVHVEQAGSSYPGLVNEIDNTIAGRELLVGVFPVGTPTAFSVFSFLGGTADEGKLSTKSNAALVAADNDFFYVAGNTSSINLPGTAGAAQAAHGANKSLADQFLSQIPLNGSAGTGFRTTYNGGEEVDLVGGLVIDLRTRDVLLFGTSQSEAFPVYNASAYSPFYQAIHGDITKGAQDITYTVFANGLASRKFSTYIGGSFNDYLGSTGKLQGTGHFQYCSTNGLTYIGTTIHSDETTIPEQWMTAIPGFDKSIPASTTSKDSHFIFAMSPNTDDFGDAPLSYDLTNPARSSAAAYKLRIGAEIDAEEKANNSAQADGDDRQNFGSEDDEDGIISLPSISVGATSYAVTVSVYNHSGATAYLQGWLDNNNNGTFDSDEFASIAIPDSAGQQAIVLSFVNLPFFTVDSGFTFLRLRLTNVQLSANDATGYFGIGEVEDHIVVQALILKTGLIDFSARLQQRQVVLNWKVTEGADVMAYVVERKNQAGIFVPIGSKLPVLDLQYQLLDASPAEGTNYYRLKIELFGGAMKYSEIKQVQFKLNASWEVFPNPATDFIKLKINAENVGKPAYVMLSSIDGRRIHHWRFQNLNDTQLLDLANYPNGQYLLQLIIGTAVTTKKIHLLHH